MLWRAFLQVARQLGRTRKPAENRQSAIDIQWGEVPVRGEVPLSADFCVRGREIPSRIVQKLADGVYASIWNEPVGLGVDANNLFVIDDEGVVVVDTNFGATSTREVLAALRTLTGKPVKYVINTHPHDDHVLGNQVYREAINLDTMQRAFAGDSPLRTSLFRNHVAGPAIAAASAEAKTRPRNP